MSSIAKQAFLAGYLSKTAIENAAAMLSKMDPSGGAVKTTDIKPTRAPFSKSPNQTLPTNFTVPDGSGTGTGDIETSKQLKDSVKVATPKLEAAPQDDATGGPLNK